MIVRPANLLPLEAFLFWEKKTPDAVLFRQPINGEIKTWTWKQAGVEARKIASAMKSYQLPAKSHVAILSKNCAHWIMADLAIMMADHISVPIYPTLDASTIQQILEHSEAKILFVGKLDKFEEQCTGIPLNIKLISFDLFGLTEGDSWSNLISSQPPIEIMPDHKADDLATIMYTSGTSGKPKGVMLTHGAISHTAETAIADLKLPQHSKMFSYLPMSHIAERIGVEIVGIYLGGTLSFAESLDVFAKNLFDAQPNIFFAVPRIWAKFQEKILEKLPQKKLDILLSLPIIKSIVKKSIRKKLGLAEASHLYTGAAPMPLSLLLWFDKLGIEIFQAYAMTENTCFGTFNRHGANKYGTVGQPLFTVEIKIGDNDEILIRHKAMLRAYYKEDGLTRDAFTTDGFFKTGDQGSVDENNFLTITGRVKDLFKTDRGKYVAPSPIEVMLMEHSDIEHACVVGVGLPQPIALTILSASAKEKSKETIAKNFAELIRALNEKLNSYERIAKIIVMKNDWTIENGLMTPTLKIKRNEIEKINQSFYQTWYGSGEVIVWE